MKLKCPVWFIPVNGLSVYELSSFQIKVNENVLLRNILSASTPKEDLTQRMRLWSKVP